MGDWGPTPPTYGTSAPVASSSGGGWEGWFQNIAGQYLQARTQLRAMENIQRGETGYYREGQPAPAAAGLGLSPGLLLLGGAVLLVFAMKD